MQYWLMKSEPDVFSFEDLKQRSGQREPWDGVRNYQARNFMRDAMKPGPISHISHRKSVRNEGKQVVTRKEKMLTILPESIRLEELNAPRGAARSPQ